MRTSQRLTWPYPSATLTVVDVTFDDGYNNSSSGRSKHRIYVHVLIISQSIIMVVAWLIAFHFCSCILLYHLEEAIMSHRLVVWAMSTQKIHKILSAESLFLWVSNHESSWKRFSVRNLFCTQSHPSFLPTFLKGWWIKQHIFISKCQFST